MYAVPKIQDDKGNYKYLRSMGEHDDPLAQSFASSRQSLPPMTSHVMSKTGYFEAFPGLHRAQSSASEWCHLQTPLQYWVHLLSLDVIQSEWYNKPVIVIMACMVDILSLANLLRLSLLICTTANGRVVPRERSELNSPSVTSPDWEIIMYKWYLILLSQCSIIYIYWQ